MRKTFCEVLFIGVWFFSQVRSATSPPRPFPEGSGDQSGELPQHSAEAEDSFGEKGDGRVNLSSEALSRETFAEAVEGCLGPQLQQLLSQQVAFLERRGLHVLATVKPQRAAVDAVYGIVGEPASARF